MITQVYTNDNAINPLSANPYKMFKHTQTIRRQKPSEEIVSVKQALFPK